MYKERFNSTLVQLKAMDAFKFNKDKLFQFYLSSIKRKNPKTGKPEPFMFQFYLSSIKSCLRQFDLNQVYKFQFYLSSIKR